MIDPSLRAALAVFDGAALATLANAGLVRRAARDVDDGKVTLIEAGDGKAVVEVDGARVSINAGGPKRASCTCTAAGVCRHRLAAVLWLQATDAAETVAPSDPVAMLDGFSDAVVMRWSGKPAWRAALEIAEQVSGVTLNANGIAVTLADLAEPVLILPAQGLDGIVSKASPGRAKAVGAAAVIAARRHFGLVAGEPEEVEAVQPAAPVRADPAFLAQVEAALVDCAGLAFNLAPEPVEEALFTLSVSSRAATLPRLSRILRTLASQLRRKRGRDFGFDPDATLELLATGFALVRALGREGEPVPERRALLHGTVRQDYLPSAPVTVIGCGSDFWRTAAGARGVTGIFYEPAGDRWLVAGPARAPGQDPLFDPALAYRTEALWGTHTLEKAVGRPLRVEGAGISNAGRMSNPSTARAHPGDVVPARADWPARLADWAALRDRLAARFGVGLGDLKRADYALLAPSRFAAPMFDDLTQELTWPVADQQGRWIGLTVGHDAVARTRRDQIDELGKRRWSGEVLVRADAVEGRIVLTPIAVLSPTQVLSLGLDTLPSEGWRSESMFGWLLALSTKGFTRAGPDASRAAFAAAWQGMIDLAEMGPDRARPAQLNRLRAAAFRFQTMGMPTVAAALDALAQTPRDRFLATSYALLVARGQRRDLPWLVTT